MIVRALTTYNFIGEALSHTSNSGIECYRVPDQDWRDVNTSDRHRIAYISIDEANSNSNFGYLIERMN